VRRPQGCTLSPRGQSACPLSLPVWGCLGQSAGKLSPPLTAPALLPPSPRSGEPAAGRPVFGSLCPGPAFACACLSLPANESGERGAKEPGSGGTGKQRGHAASTGDPGGRAMRRLGRVAWRRQAATSVAQTGGGFMVKVPPPTPRLTRRTVQRAREHVDPRSAPLLQRCFVRFSGMPADAVRAPSAWPDPVGKRDSRLPRSLVGRQSSPAPHGTARSPRIRRWAFSRWQADRRTILPSSGSSSTTYRACVLGQGRDLQDAGRRVHFLRDRDTKVTTSFDGPRVDRRHDGAHPGACVERERVRLALGAHRPPGLPRPPARSFRASPRESPCRVRQALQPGTTASQP
jgi:hypothetical protein